MKLHIQSLLKEHSHIKEVIVKEIHDITLQDGFYPSIGSEDPASTKNRRTSVRWNEDLVPLEPAIWFKVNLIDVIDVDCTERCVSWQLLNPEERSMRKTYKTLDPSSAFNGDYEAQLDQLINESQSLVDRFDLLETHYFKGLVLKLLHCHILPLITLHTEDIPQLVKFNEQQRGHIKNVENKMGKTNESLDEIQNLIYVQCENYIREVDESEETPSYPIHFVKILLRDLIEYTNIAQDRFNDLQHEVDKVRMSASDVLQEKRKIRNEAHITFQNRLKARENAQSLIDEISHFAKDKLENVGRQLYIEYMSLDKKRSCLLNELLILSNQKVLMSSVFEAVKCTIEEIKVEKESLGTDYDVTGQKPTDVLGLRNSLIPIDCMPMIGQVYSLVMDIASDLGKERQQMIETVITQGTQACYEADLQQATKQSMQNIEQEMFLPGTDHTGAGENKTDMIELTEGLTESKNFVLVLDQNINYCKQRANSLKRDISDHFKSMCAKLQAVVAQGSIDRRTLWLLYEPHFFKDTMGHLQSLYKKAYSESCKKLQSNMTQLTTKEIEIKTDYVLQMLQEIDAAKDQNLISPQFQELNLCDQKSVILNPADKVEFVTVYRYIYLLIQQTTPMDKFQYLNKCLIQISEVFDTPAAADELLDLVVIMLCNCDVQDVTALYVDLKLLDDLVAPFLESGQYCYSLVQFWSAFEYILDRISHMKVQKKQK